MYLLGICGKKHSGKDTVCRMIKDLLHPLTVEKISFADSLKEEVAKGCGVTIQYLEEHKENFRLILQGWGKDFRRDLYRRDYWIIRWMQKVNSISDKTYCIIAADIRFMNEANLIQDYGGRLIKIDRPNILNNDKHISENEVLEN